MKSIILFRCHDHAAICKSRIEFLSLINPDIPIIGLFGGKAESFGAYKRAIGNNIIESWYCTGKIPIWNWQHGDLAIRTWFNDYGRYLNFNRIYLVEWDLLLLEPLEKLYEHVSPKGIAVTAPFHLEKVGHNYGWVNNEPYKTQWHELLSFVRNKYSYKDETFISLGLGTCYSRLFMELYCETEIPEISSDELRVPLFAQCFGIPIFDTKFMTSWDDPDELLIFNCQNNEISIDLIHSEMIKLDGRRVFHPFRQQCSMDQFILT